MIKKICIIASAIIASTQAAIINKCVNKGMLALTFDNGPADFSGAILDELAKNNVTAAFHVQTNYFTDPTVVARVKRIAAEGHLIGIAGNPNTDYRTVSTTDIVNDFNRAATVIASLTGYWPKVVRMPFNKFDNRVVGALEGAGFYVTQHNLDSFDYTVPDSEKIYSAFQLSFALHADGEGNFIALQHDAVEGNIKALPDIVDLAISKKYKIVRLDQCIGVGNLTETTTSVNLPSASLRPTTLTASTSTKSSTRSVSAQTGAGESLQNPVYQIIIGTLAAFGAFLFLY